LSSLQVGWKGSNSDLDAVLFSPENGLNSSIFHWISFDSCLQNPFILSSGHQSWQAVSSIGKTLFP
jgi:hypothetical protein